MTEQLKIIDDFFSRLQSQHYKEIIDNYVEKDKLNYVITDSGLSEIVSEKLHTLHLHYLVSDKWYLTRYSPNMSYSIHRDGVLKMQGTNRCAAIIIYLSSQFENGKLQIYHEYPLDLDPLPHREIIPKIGRAIIIGSNIWHSAEAPRNGDKYMLRSDLAICV